MQVDRNMILLRNAEILCWSFQGHPWKLTGPVELHQLCLIKNKCGVRLSDKRSEHGIASTAQGISSYHDRLVYRHMKLWCDTSKSMGQSLGLTQLDRLLQLVAPAVEEEHSCWKCHS